MHTFRLPEKSIVGGTVLASTAAVALAVLTNAVDAWTAQPTDLAGRIASMREQLPKREPDGSVLDDLSVADGRLTLRLTVDERLDLAALRDIGRQEKCAAWRDVLRARELTVVEYRYRQTGATSSLFLDRTVCG